MKKIVVVILFLFLFPVNLVQAKTLRVGYIGSPPYVNSNNARSPGMAIAFWKEIANKKRWDYKLINEGVNIKSALARLNSNKLDILVGGISVTKKRIKYADFSRPFFISRTGLLVSSHAKYSVITVLKSIMKEVSNFHFILIVFIFLIFIHIVWGMLKGADVPDKYFKGIFRSSWVFLLAVFSGEFTYDTAKTAGRRILSGFLAIVSTFILSVFVATLAGAFTYALTQGKSITTIAEIGAQPVAVIRGTAGAELAVDLGLNIVSVHSIAEGVTLVKNKNLIGLIGDTPVIKYYLRNHPTKDVKIAPLVLNYDEVAFAFPLKKIKFREEFNLVLAQMQQDGSAVRLCRRYIGGKDAELCAL